MRVCVLVFLFACLSATAQVNPSSVTAQPTVIRDPQAVAVINAAAAALLGSSGASDIAGYTASGAITSWAGHDVSAPVNVKGEGTNAFRIDANLPDGNVSWAVHDGTGTILSPNGSKSDIPHHNAVTLGVLTFPLAKLVAAANDPATSLDFLGTITGPAGQQAYKIRIHKNLVAPAKDYDGSINRLLTADLLIASASYQLLAIRDHTHPVDAANVDIDHEVRFSDYRQVNGMNVPFSISEFIAGQRTFAIQLSSFSLDTGLSTADFIF